MTSALAREREVSCAGQWDGGLEVGTSSRGLWPGRKKEDREFLDGPV